MSNDTFLEEKLSFLIVLVKFYMTIDLLTVSAPGCGCGVGPGSLILDLEPGAAILCLEVTLGVPSRPAMEMLVTEFVRRLTIVTDISKNQIKLSSLKGMKHSLSF